MIIRRATIKDKEELIRILKVFQLFDDYLSETQRKIRAFEDPDKMAENMAEKYLSKPEYIIFVVEGQGRIIGFISGEIKQKKYRVYKKEGYVDAWFVEENYQSQGIGKELFNKLTEEFKKAGCTHIGLETNLENEKAIKIYEKMGLTKLLVSFFKPLQ